MSLPAFQKMAAATMAVGDDGPPSLQDSPEIQALSEAEPATKPPIAVPANTLYEVAGVSPAAPRLSWKGLPELNKATFADQRWSKAQGHLFGEREGPPTSADRELATQVLLSGARAFGIWHISTHSLEPLQRQLLGEVERPSPPLAMWLRREERHERYQHQAVDDGEVPQRALVNAVSMNEAEVRAELKNRKWQGFQRAFHDGYVHFSTDEVFAAKVILTALVFVISTAYALRVVLYSYPTIITVFTWPIFVARAGGMACAILTGVLFLRTASKEIYNLLPFGKLGALFTGHKDLHIFAGIMMLFFGVVHTIAHLIGTAPAVQSHSHEELNNLLGCANPAETPGYLGARFQWLQWPACPLSEDYTYMDVVFRSTP
eukprot:CAMPEP_0170645316 /NCGR_PEP_ID=MMETSP0224-20130122/43006_1 /TAXON_ID=285029 /ORGANISM="Togula jolla, Strain CCCM 725" /LENGTH=374 /DNA_ID=CAMNT_0010976507 /DNA_START=27 /DNA_END=1147 /DNA_ORIENTATION=+